MSRGGMCALCKNAVICIVAVIFKGRGVFMTALRETIILCVCYSNFAYGIFVVNVRIFHCDSRVIYKDINGRVLHQNEKFNFLNA